MGFSRLIGFTVLSIVMGIIMATIYRKEEAVNAEAIMAAVPEGMHVKKWWVQLVFFGLLVAIMVLVTSTMWIASAVATALLIGFFVKFFSRDDFFALMSATLDFMKKIYPWVLVGMVGALLIVVFLPSGVVVDYVGGNSLLSCFSASIAGSVLYLCPPSEVLYTRAFTDLNMGFGPALSFILTAPTVSIPSMIVLGKIIGFKKTFTYIALLIVLTTFSGFIYGLIVG